MGSGRQSFQLGHLTRLWALLQGSRERTVRAAARDRFRFELADAFPAEAIPAAGCGFGTARPQRLVPTMGGGGGGGNEAECSPNRTERRQAHRVSSENSLNLVKHVASGDTQVTHVVSEWLGAGWNALAGSK